jgi:hypothetical protein
MKKPLLTVDNILKFCRYKKSDKQVYNYFGITDNERYETRFVKLKQNLIRKELLCEQDGTLLTISGKYARYNPPPAVEATGESQV